VPGGEGFQNVIVTLSAFIVALGVLVVIHELGHFLAAKRLGILVERFSVGFGPIVASRQSGETEYALSAIPLGGYVKMLGEEDDGDGVDEPVDDRSFAGQSVPRRVAVVAAGPLMNLGFALLAYVALALVYGEQVPSPAPIVGSVAADLPAHTAGLQPGDRVVSMDGQPIETWEALAEGVRASGGKLLQLAIEREGHRRIIEITPELQPIPAAAGEPSEVYLIGVGPHVDRREIGFVEAVDVGFRQTVGTSWLVAKNFALMFVGRVPLRELGGPIAIAQAAGEQARAGVEAFLNMLAFLSVNLGVLNLLPIPVLDGGLLAMLGIEAVLQRRLHRRVRETVQQIGVLVLVSLMLLVLFNDVSRLVQG